MVDVIITTTVVYFTYGVKYFINLQFVPVRTVPAIFIKMLQSFKTTCSDKDGRCC